MAHPLTILLVLVRRHVDDEQPAAGLQHARGFGERVDRATADGAARASASRRRATTVSIGSASSAPARSSTFGEVARAAARGRQHLVGRIDADHARDVRREQRQHRAGAAAEVADDPVAPAAGRRAAPGTNSRPNSSSRRRSHSPADVAKNCCRRLAAPRRARARAAARPVPRRSCRRAAACVSSQICACAPSAPARASV